jgi:hypothetical protein
MSYLMAVEQSGSRPDYLGVLIRLTPALKKALVAEAERRGTNMNDVAVGTLARRYGEPFSPSDRCCHTAGYEALRVLLRMSPKLKRKIQFHALDADSNITDTICRVMAVELGVAIDLPEPTRRTPFGGGPRKYRASLGEERMSPDSEAA